MNIYDFDGTLYLGDSTRDFLIYSIKKHPSLIRFLPSQGWAAALYFLGKLPKTAMKERIYRMFTGYDAPGLLEEFWNKHQHKVFPWYPGGLQREDDIVISASPEFLLEPICQRLGIRHLMASRVDPRTGAYTGENCWGPEKVIRLKDQMGITHCEGFYSDSYSDQPLADISDTAYRIDKGQILPWGRPYGEAAAE